MPTGVVKRLVKDRGFGFIKAQGKEYFFHRSGVKNNGYDDLEENQNVAFEEEPSSKGPRASSIVPLD